MSVKGIIDRARTIAGYDGAAILADGSILFIEGMDEHHAQKLYSLFADISAIFKEKPSFITMESGHRTVEAMSNGNIVAFVRHSGRPGTGISLDEDPELVDVSSLSMLPSRDAARSEAASILKRMGF